MADELEHEREYVHHLYGRLDALRDQKRDQLERVRSTGAIGSRQNQSERDAFATLYEDRLAQLDAVEERLAFGRLDLDQDHAQEPSRYIGRIGLTEDDQTRLLVDWRAPEAAAFYQATAFDRRGVSLRRHLTLKRRDVVSIEDDVLDPERALAEGSGQGDGALLAALNARRTGRMGDIVATIQAEQDRIIRAPLPGVLVVQGGPGTGKTAVALHRAAFLLYEQRERLRRAGVLVVGPSDAFLRYIDRVLPSLGETGVVMSSLGRLWPGLDAAPEQERHTARVKGSLRMAEAIKAAVAQRQRVPAGPRTVVVEGTKLVLTPQQVRRARDRARQTHKPYNEARETFVKILVRELADQLQAALEASSGGGNDADRSYLAEDVRTSGDVRVALNLCWMPMTPQRLLEGIFSDERILQAVTKGWSEKDRAALRREPGHAWTESDVPLLDEAADLLGQLDPTAGRAAAELEAQRKRDLENAEQAVRNVHAQLSEEGIEGFIDAESLAGYNEVGIGRATAAEAAAEDRTWTYGHVVVDEAQELSPMQWRLLMRRCPIKSFTVVGDMAQADAPAASSSWAQALEPFVEDRFTLAELTVNYRTPRQVVELAERVASDAGLRFSRGQAVRDAELETALMTVPDAAGLGSAVMDQVALSLAQVPGGLCAVVTAAQDVDALRAAAQERFAGRVGEGAGDAASGRDVLVLSATEAKGLEFDAVVVADPGAVVRESDGVVGNLYVALTRTTQRLAVVSVGQDAPAALLQSAQSALSVAD
ncbi:HelD family protein [Galactobacter caseinivorans]|uniref:AAA family ATPase n=1 Tax=Galactobacter caseinivorans TaxID=2676123 RepID=A0A496PK76_9MICC|nr:UvrD-helicase domain-containing protein [Galactobacter caseinivorans]RKW70868.1 AAA family ATPase [Galactobacter caseinivorans]